MPVIAAAQLSRAVEQREDKRPQLADLRESGSIVQDADIVMFIYREDYYVAARQPREAAEAEDPKGYMAFREWQEEMDKVSGLAEIIVAKQRHGATGKVRLRFDAKITRFSDHADADYMPEMRG